VWSDDKQFASGSPSPGVEFIISLHCLVSSQVVHYSYYGRPAHRGYVGLLVYFDTPIASVRIRIGTTSEGN